MTFINIVPNSTLELLLPDLINTKTCRSILQDPLKTISSMHFNGLWLNQ